VSKPIVKLYYYELPRNESSNDWYLTSDSNVANLGLNFRTASLIDLQDWECLGHFPMKAKVLHVDEGFFKWNDTYGENGDYEFICEVKDYVLERMEELGFENSMIYEYLIAMKEFKVHSWLDLNDYSELLS
jgi:hypothetical protein